LARHELQDNAVIILKDEPDQKFMAFELIRQAASYLHFLGERLAALGFCVAPLDEGSFRKRLMQVADSTR
jgi:hypothetical protein